MTTGVMTDRWGLQPFAWIEGGLITWSWQGAPAGLVTRRQMRALGLAPGGAQIVGQIIFRGGTRKAYLYDRAELVPKRIPTPAQLEALKKALAARRWCPSCQRDAGYCLPTSIGKCVDCAYPELAEADQAHRDQFEAAA